MRILALVSAFLVGGCASAGTFSPVAPTSYGALAPVYPRGDAAEYARFATRGDGALAGQVFLTTRGGEVRVGAGRTVTLDPATSLSRSWYDQIGAAWGRFDEMPADSLFRAARRSTIADASGNYRFTDLPAGSYLVRSTLTWEVAGDMQGGVLAESVALRPGEQKSLMIQTVVGQAIASKQLAIIPMIEAAQIGTRPYSKIGSASGKSCAGSGSGKKAETIQSEALSRMQENAKQLGGSAVMSAQCRTLTNILSDSCLFGFECIGDVIVFT